MLILNYAHPLTDAHLAQLADLTGQPVEAVREIPTHLDMGRPFAPQAVALADAAGLDANAWQTKALLIVLPSLNYAAAALLAVLHGRMGYFPPIVRLRPVPDVLPPRFEIAELLNLQTLRDAARERRYNAQSGALD